jgi:hypothetical protein
VNATPFSRSHAFSRCIAVLNSLSSTPLYVLPPQVEAGLCVGACGDLTVKEAWRQVVGWPLPPPYACETLPCAQQLLFEGEDHSEDDEIGVIVSKRYQKSPLTKDAYDALCCATCGRVPALQPLEKGKTFLVCSLCGDRRYHFCTKRPCFEAFWKGGHKNECPGREDFKERRKGKEGEEQPPPPAAGGDAGAAPACPV